MKFNQKMAMITGIQIIDSYVLISLIFVMEKLMKIITKEWQLYLQEVLYV